MSTPVEFTRGDTIKALQVTIKDSSGVAVNLTGGSVRFQARGVEGPVFSYAGNLSTTVSVNTVTRASGNFTTDGVQVGQLLRGAIAQFFPLEARITAVGTTTVTMSLPALATSSSQSGDIFGWTIDIAGTLVDAPNGITSFASVGNAIAAAYFGQRRQILFDGAVKYTSNTALVGFSSDIPVRITVPKFS